MPSATSSAIDPVGIPPTGTHGAARGGAAEAEPPGRGHRPGGDHLDRDARLLAEPHDRALAELPLDLQQRGLERLVLVAGPLRCRRLAAWCHGDSLSLNSAVRLAAP